MTLLVELTGTHYQYFIVRMTTSAILPMDLIISLEEEKKKEGKSGCEDKKTLL